MRLFNMQEKDLERILIDRIQNEDDVDVLCSFAERILGLEPGQVRLDDTSELGNILVETNVEEDGNPFWIEDLEIYDIKEIK